MIPDGRYTVYCCMVMLDRETMFSVLFYIKDNSSQGSMDFSNQAYAACVPGFLKLLLFVRRYACVLCVCVAN